MEKREPFEYRPDAIPGGTDAHGDVSRRPERPAPRPGVWPCPCCGFKTFPDPAEDAVAYICPVCFWENDVFTSSGDEPSDENHGMTLNQGRENFRRFGAAAAGLCLPRPAAAAGGASVRPPRYDITTKRTPDHDRVPRRTI